MLIFSAVSAALIFGILCFQDRLPLNPQHFAGIAPLLAFNIAVSFMTTTDWQAYSGESTLSYFSQMAGLGWQNFTAAAIGLAVAIAAIRGFTRSGAQTLGNFWVDLTRAIFYVLLPLSIAGALLLVWQGTPQTLAPYGQVTTLEGAPQTIVSGPIASQEIIKQLGVNGGKKIEQREITLVMIATLVPALSMLVPAALALAPGVSSTGNGGPRGFTEILYAFTSVSANNGSALGGLTIQTDIYNWLTAGVMVVGRFATIALVLALAATLARKPRNVAVTTGTLSTASPMFALLLIATAIIVTALTFVPADALGPIAEHLFLRTGQTF